MKMTITEVSLHPKDESPIFSIMATKVSLCDDGAGAFVKLIQEDESGKLNEVRFDFNEIEALVEAIKLLESGVADEND